MNLTEISKRYAKALFAVSKESSSHAQTLASLVAVSAATNPLEVQNFLKDPQIDSAKKADALLKTMEKVGTTDSVKNFVKLLMNKNRVGILSSVAKAYEKLIDEDSGITKGYVYSAHPLSPSAISSLEIKISSILKKKIVLESKEDSKIIGGVVAKVGGWTFDDSLDLHLKKLKEELINH